MEGRNSDISTKEQESWWLYQRLYNGEITNRPCGSRKEGKGLANIEDNVDVSKQGHEDYNKNNKERIIIAASNSNRSKNIGLKTTKTKKQKWEENCVDILIDKLAILHSRRPWYGLESEILRKRLNLF